MMASRLVGKQAQTARRAYTGQMSGTRSIEVKSARELLEFELSSAATLSSGCTLLDNLMEKKSREISVPWWSPCESTSPEKFYRLSTFVVFCNWTR
ncbi:hypothetical protein KIN20_021772 [Parelaphostrongylus tenuis]|uniref:Uncharacterized protein n=1 Tax=Parelaphostrongylus tenuis TaxID=148309 RepID=A0AAD5NB37_PARTN|nr:hypothetical protein KIN20_021772 [Parelaphostrongylus tenuis]